jgi:hypothetical protein
MRHGVKFGPSLFVGELPEGKDSRKDLWLMSHCRGRRLYCIRPYEASRTAICEANSIEVLYRLVPANITWRALTKGHETNTQKQERDPNNIALHFGSVFELYSENSKAMMIKRLAGLLDSLVPAQ